MRIARTDWQMKSFKRIGVQVLTDAIKVKRLTLSKALFKRLSRLSKSFSALQEIWDALPHTPIQKAIRSFRKRLQSCVRAEGGHFEHLL